jgi:hypothetical protein
MNKFKLDLFKSILTLNQEDLHDFLANFISEYYVEPEIIEVDGSFKKSKKTLKLRNHSLKYL